MREKGPTAFHMRIGAGVWHRAKTTGVDIEAATQECSEQWCRKLPKEQHEGTDTLLRMSVAWARYGFPQIRLTAKQAASFCCTSTESVSGSDLKYPWGAFVIGFPRCLPVRNRVFLSRTSNKVFLAHYEDMGEDGETRITVEIQNSLEAFRDDTDPIVGVACDPRLFRMLLYRIIVGTILESTSFTREQADPVANKRREYYFTRPGGPPVGKPWIFEFTRDVTIDLSEHVRRRVCGETGGKLTLQHVVRGHWKHQPCGKDHAQRKHIHIEPYWRGPNDAPIAVRSHVLGEV